MSVYQENLFQSRSKKTSIFLHLSSILDSYANPRLRLGLHNCREFSQLPECLDEAMEIRKTSSIA